MKNILSPGSIKFVNELINQARFTNASVEQLQKAYREAHFEELDRKDAQAILAYLKSQEKSQVSSEFQSPEVARSVTDGNIFADSYLAQDIAEAISNAIATQVTQAAANGTLKAATAQAVISATQAPQLVPVLRGAASSTLPTTYPNSNNPIMNAASTRYVYHHARQNPLDRHAQFVFKAVRMLSEILGRTVQVSEVEAAMLAFTLARSVHSATAFAFGNESTLNLNHDPRFVGSVKPAPTTKVNIDNSDNKEDVKSYSLEI